MSTRLGVALIWLLHFLPLPVLARLGGGLGTLLYLAGRERRRVARTNLRLCVPQQSERERHRLLRGHYRAFGRSVLERGIAWWSRPARLRRLVRVEGLEHWQAVRDRPVIWLAPHFVGLDMSGARLASEFAVASVYSRQKNPVFERLLYRARLRFGGRLYSRQDGVRPVIRALRDGLPLYYLPDLDYGPRDAVFVPFFGVPAATVTALPRMAGIAGAAVVPAVTRQLPGGRGYVVRFYPAWEGFPGNDVAADTRRMNAFIEARVLEMPEQYYWLHKRFKTRPPGEASPYRFAAA